MFIVDVSNWRYGTYIVYVADAVIGETVGTDRKNRADKEHGNCIVKNMECD